MNDEQLDSLLRAADASAGAPAAQPADLADRVRLAEERRRQRARRAAIAVGLAGCYLAGMATMWSVFAVAAGEDANVVRRATSPRRAAPVGAAAPPSPEQRVPNQDIRPRPPVRQDFVVEKSRYELLRQLGDESQLRGDLQAAVAYYGRALDTATDAERRVSYEQDNWLLISLKKDRFVTQTAPTHGDST